MPMASGQASMGMRVLISSGADVFARRADLPGYFSSPFADAKHQRPGRLIYPPLQSAMTGAETGSKHSKG
jgi:hypothetical protein